MCWPKWSPIMGIPCRPKPRMDHTLRLRSSQVAALSPVQAAVKAPDPRNELLHSCASLRGAPASLPLFKVIFASARQGVDV